MKIDELTDRLLKDGVEKGNAEAERIIGEAQEKAKGIIAEAQKEALQIKERTEREMEELRKNVKSELQLCAAQTIGALKTDIADVVCGKVVDENVKAVEVDKAFICGIIVKLTESMLSDGSISIKTGWAEELQHYFEENAKHLLNKGVTVEASFGNKMQFTLVCEQKNYKIQFGEAELETFFKSFLRQNIIEYLFK